MQRGLNKYHNFLWKAFLEIENNNASPHFSNPTHKSVWHCNNASKTDFNSCPNQPLGSFDLREYRVIIQHKMTINENKYNGSS
jgi:hypothetical protein